MIFCESRTTELDRDNMDQDQAKSMQTEFHNQDYSVKVQSITISPQRMGQDLNT